MEYGGTFFYSREPIVILDKTECNDFDCNQPIKAKGLCKRHYEQKLHQMRSKNTCSIDGCECKQHKRRLCYFHYSQFTANNRCCIENCVTTIYEDSLCKNHYLEKKGRCVYKDCESKTIFCIKKMLCKKHYSAISEEKRRNNKRKNMETRDDYDIIFKERKKNLELT